MKFFGNNVKSELPIFAVDFQNRPELDTARLAVIEIQKTTPGIESNVKSVYTSPYDSHLRNDNLVPLSKLVCQSAAFVTENALGQKLDFDIINCWVSIYQKGDFTINHNHWPSLFSAVVYLEASEKSAPLIFENEISVPAIRNNMILFPGWIKHSVPPTEEERVIVAYNLTAIFSNGNNKFD